MTNYKHEKCYCPTCQQEQDTRTYMQVIEEELKLGTIVSKSQVWDCLVCKNTWSKSIERTIKYNDK